MSDDITISQDIKNAVDTLRRGGIIVYPTDTIWGIGCDATNQEAVAKVFEIKKRSDAKSLILLVDSIAAVERIVGEIPDAAEQLIDVAVKPMTIIYDHARGVAPGVVAKDGSVAIRITEERFSKELCRRFGRPIVSTSANISGEPSAPIYSMISKEILDSADYVAHTRRDDLKKSVASDIIKVTDSNVITIIR